MGRGLCLLVGYLFGCFLTAELVARWKTGRGAGALGTGNPGMASIGSALGVKAAAVVLAGDILKTALACLLCRLALAPELGGLAVLYAGVGAVLGHNFPFWRRFRGGKGVAVTCTVLVLYAPLWGTLSGLVGLGIVAVLGYLPLGAVAIPAVFVPAAFACYGVEPGAVALFTALLMLSRHIHGLERMARGEKGRVGHRKRAGT